MAIKRYGTADEVASLTLYLAGTQARGITGAMHTIDGASPPDFRYSPR
ncbi:hypothetical protein [Mesorhizobium sanjuanii]|nr:hypothetical protein [Mesorhizobium sanjuanii]